MLSLPSHLFCGLSLLPSTIARQTALSNLSSAILSTRSNHLLSLLLPLDSTHFRIYLLLLNFLLSFFFPYIFLKQIISNTSVFYFIAHLMIKFQINKPQLVSSLSPTTAFVLLPQLSLRPRNLSSLQHPMSSSSPYFHPYLSSFSNI